MKQSSKLFICLIASLSLSACGAADRLSNVGKVPEVEPISNPAQRSSVQTVSMPMPPVEIVEKENNSLWASNRQTFFKDQRANNIGDILTVMIDIDDEAELENESERSRSSNEGVGIDGLFGIESQITKVLPTGMKSLMIKSPKPASAMAEKGRLPICNNPATASKSLMC